MHAQHLLRYCLRLLLAATFLYAGVVKLPDMAGFASVIGGFGLLPAALHLPAAYVLVALELGTGLALLTPWRGAVALCAAQLLLFIAVLGWGLHLGLDTDCGCFGPGDAEGDYYHSMNAAILRDVALLAACAALWWLTGKRNNTTAFQTRIKGERV